MSDIQAADKKKPKPISTPKHDAGYLYGRQGYRADFLGISPSLPTFAAGPNPDVAPVYSGVGPNGDHILDYTHYSVCFNKAEKLPFFTAVNIDGWTNYLNQPHEERKGDVWYFDDRISDGSTPDNFQFSHADYSAVELDFDRGHMVRFYDPAWGSGTNMDKKLYAKDTLYYTNCCPQIHNFNDVTWGDLEDYCLARSFFKDINGKVTIFTGPLFDKIVCLPGLFLIKIAIKCLPLCPGINCQI